jgi:hypothetical protein
LQPRVLRQTHHPIEVLHSLARCSLHKIVYLVELEIKNNDLASLSLQHYSLLFEDDGPSKNYVLKRHSRSNDMTCVRNIADI